MEVWMQVTAPFEKRIVAAFESRLHGSVIVPGDQEYDAARRVWNGMIDKYPAIIVRCASVADVVASVNFARDNDLLVSVRGGGHNVAGHATNDGGIVIDLSGLKEIAVDPETRVVRAGGGVTLGELDAATQAYGLATPSGVFTRTGVGGLTLGGGFGWLSHPYGLACDNLIGAEVVLADGSVVRTSERENPELLWGLRGGGGNFGIVTTFEFRLHPVGPEVYMTFVLHNGEGDRMARVIRAWRDYCATAPDEVSSLLALGIVPPTHHFPAEIQGKPMVIIGALHSGAPEQGKHELQPLSDIDVPLIDFSGVMPFIEAQQMFDEDYPDGLRYYWKSLNLMRFDDEVIEMVVEHARKQPSPYSTIDIWHIGGAVHREPAGGSAYNGRHVTFLLSPEANWEDAADDEANISWLRALIADAEQYSDGGRYLNFAGFQEEGDAMMAAAFGDRYERLVALKNQYDPGNLFSLNQNIAPRSPMGTLEAAAGK
jgi:FAD/FMN-containing dehydrogenase